MSQLRVEHLSKNFGGLQVLTDVNFTVEAGERRAIIGPNGAGKTTLFNLISGELPPSQGSIYLGEQNVTARSAHLRACMGMGRTFQRNNLFLSLTVFENVRLAVQQEQGSAGHLWHPASTYAQVQAETMTWLAKVGLAEQRDKLVRHLAYGQQRTLEVALALATKPQVLLLDEPTAGMSPAETTAMARFIEALPRTLTILIVEHDMDVVFSLADRITVLHYGKVIAEGTPAEVRADAKVQAIYLGQS